MNDQPRYRIAFSPMELDGKIPQGAPIWGEFNRSFENLELTPPMIALLIDDGRAFTTWHTGGRKGENYICGQHLGLDFDTRSVADVLEEPFVQKYAALVYATPSSTPEAPHCRALFLLDRPIMQAQNYVAAATALIWSFGGTADRRCKDAARFFYGSLGSMPTRLDNELPLDAVRDLIAKHTQWQAMQAPPPKPANYTPRTADAADAQKLLDRLDSHRADDYGDWVTVGMALSTLGDEGLRLWDNWSARSTKHVTGECKRKWKSFDGNGITLATLGMMAKQDSPR